jgi:NitT/TauT family transport system substrate-binding protein
LLSRMEMPMALGHSRRHFLAGASLATAAAVLGTGRARADERPPEITTIRLRKSATMCVAPRYIAEDLLRAEGFTDVQYISDPPIDAVAGGEIDFEIQSATWIISELDAGKPITALVGVHPGCYELFAHEPIRTITDLKGRKVGIRTLGSSEHLLIAIMAAHVGLDPQSDIKWVTRPIGKSVELFAKKEVDAFLGFPPEPQEMRARKIGRVILNTTTDKPWSQYFCCLVCGNRGFVRNYPVATKRALRAILKAADLCAAEPEWAAQHLVDAGFTERYDYALQILTEVPYASWREFDPEDSLRFYSLRLHEVGMVKLSPNRILAEGTDWRFLNELKRELKM